jgi:hypothetical protein
VRESPHTTQWSGETGATLPEEFRSRLCHKALVNPIGERRPHAEEPGTLVPIPEALDHRDCQDRVAENEHLHGEEVFLHESVRIALGYQGSCPLLVEIGERDRKEFGDIA